MKKIFILMFLSLITLLSAIGLVACGAPDNGGESGNNNGGNTPPNIETPNDGNPNGSSTGENIQLPDSNTPGGSSNENDTDNTMSNSPESILQPTEGLLYRLSNDETYYVCCGMGTATDANIVIAKTYNNLPVSEIGSQAFFNVDGLKSITIPNSIINIELGAMANSYDLETVVFEKNSKLERIGYGAFTSCNSLVNITIPASVTHIGELAFHWCEKLENIKVEDNNKSYSSQDGVLYSKYKTTLIVYPSGKTDTHFTILDCVTGIMEAAFYEVDCLESITVSENNSNFSSQDGILYDKNKSDILYVPKAIKGSATIPNTITSIGFRAFSGCSSLTSIIIPSSVTSIDDWAFDDCINLTIYAETQSKPDGWSSSWNVTNCPVVWGYQE